MQEYLLEEAKAFAFFKQNLLEVNALSNAVLELLETQHGNFYAFLPEHISPNKLHEFNTGGKTSSLRTEISIKLTNILNSEHNLSCIFDDFNSTLNSAKNNDLYQSNGLHYRDEIYYQIHCGADRQLVLRCLNYSNAIWHSLCIVFKDDSNMNKEVTDSQLKRICKNAIFIMIGAYDSESYIYWSHRN